jgi:hypothetical protein
MRKIATLALTGLFLAPLTATEAAAEIDVRPDGLTHYSYCVSQAKDSSAVYVLDRHVLYRCRDEVATSYFNYLGQKRVRDKVVDEPTGVFVYRKIDGVGRCWNKIANEAGAPVSVYGCDVYVDI